MRPNVRITNLNTTLKPTPGTVYASLAVSNAVVELPALHAQTTHVFVSLDGADARLTADAATDPVGGATGHKLPNGMSDTWSREFAEKVKLIRDAGTDAALRITEMTL